MTIIEIERNKIIAALRGRPLGLRADEVCVALQADAKGKHRLRRLLAELLEEGLLEKAAGGRFRVVGDTAAPPPPSPGATPASGAFVPAAQHVVGRLRVHPAGYGFVVRDDGHDDVYVPARFRGSALDGDKVALITWTGHRGTEGRVEGVVLRGRAKLTGIVQRERGGFRLVCDDPRIVTPVWLDSAGGAGDGQAVVAEIVRYPSDPEAALQARVAHLLGDPDDPRTEVEKTLICGDIPIEFPADVLAAAGRAPETVRPEDLVDRVDLRDRQFVTIDPETARDFDDAVCVEESPRPGHDRLWVAVADVSHYVRPGEALDREARVRGCSVYLPDRAIPMLPKQLSSHICSLNPEVERLAMVVRMEIDANGAVVDPYFCAAVIRSRARLDYAGVAAALAGDLRGPRARYQSLVPYLGKLREVALRLRALRIQRGALDFELPEAKVMLDEDDPKRVRDIAQSRSDPEVRGAYQMVEDFMLAANEAVARFFRGRGLSTIWRVHDVPSDERLDDFASVAHAYGLEFSPDDGRDPKKLRGLMLSLAERPEGVRRALQFLLLRALKQAQYDIINVGHFGLGMQDYLHFTSPIRRYPDLLAHRLLKHALHKDGVPAGGPPGPRPSDAEILLICGESSSAERRAMQVEREIVDMYRAYYMRAHIGEQYEGTISGVSGFGFYVQIEAPFVEGMVRADRPATPDKPSSGLDDGVELDETGYRLLSRRSGRAFSLGDWVRVEILESSVPRRKIELGLLEHRSTHAALPRAAGRGRGKPLRRGEKQPMRTSHHRPAPTGRDAGGRPTRGGGRPGRGGGGARKGRRS